MHCEIFHKQILSNAAMKKLEKKKRKRPNCARILHINEHCTFIIIIISFVRTEYEATDRT